MKTAIFSAMYTLLMLLAGTIPGSAELLVLKFGLYTADKPSKLVMQFRPILNELELNFARISGSTVKIKTVIAKSYQEGQDNLVQGRVDFSRMGPASYIAVKQRKPEIEILATESKGGRKVFYGIICVPEDSAIQNVSELKGKRFAFGSKSSTIGRYLSQLLLAKNDITAPVLAGFEYMGRHDLVGIAVAANRFDAGALKQSTFNSLVEKGYKLRAIARMENVTQPWIAGAHLPLKTLQTLRLALLQVQDMAALKALKTGTFLEGDDSDYDSIREAIEQNDRFME